MTRAKFAVLYAGALLGAVAIVPYSFRLIRHSGRPISPSRFLLLSLAQNAALFGVVIALGLLVARAVGFGAPYVEAALGGQPPDHSFGEMLVWSLWLGGAGGALLLTIDLILIPHLPALLALARKTSLWENFTASFYGGLNEELLFRLLGLSGIAWLLSRAWHTPSGRPSDATLWSANLIMAVVFALGHLPAALAITGSITPLLVGRTLVLNMPIALICGWLLWQFGIEAAIAAHFTSDLVYHVGGTLLLRANDQFGILPWFPPASTWDGQLMGVYASGPKIMVLGTGQAPLEAAPFNKDIFGVEVAFERDAGGKVMALTLNTRRQVLRSARH